MPRFEGFIGGSNVDQSLVSDAEDTINWYVETSQSKAAASPNALYPAPGFKSFGLVPDVVGRGVCNAAGRIFAAIGASLYELNSDGTWSNWGILATNANPAQLFFNGVVGGQIGIASGGNFYVFVLATNTLTLVLNGETTIIAYAAGFFFSFNLATGKVKESALNDGTNWSGGNFFQRSLFPDPWQTMFVDANNLLWLIGTETFEVWYNTGVGNQPWAPLSGLVGLYGIAAPFAFTTTALGNLWLSANKQGTGQLLLTTGGVPQSVSTYAFDVAVSGYLNTSKISDAEMVSYQQQGHTFACVSFPSVPQTWAFDLEGTSFAKRGVWNPMLGRFDLWAPRVILPAFGKTLAFSRTSGVICDMNPAYTTEFDGVTGIVRERTSPPLVAEHARKPIDRLELLMDTGITSAQTGQGSAPVITLRVSTDGGYTWGNERQAGIGRIGKFRTRVYWDQLGAHADTVVRVRSTDPAPSRILDAWLNNVEQVA